MTGNEKIPWKRLTVEAAAIVGSILLAFALNAWWQDRVEAQREREILLALLDDFESTKGENQPG